MAVLLISVPFGITGMIFMKALFDYVCTFINGWPNKKIIGYSPVEQWRDILPEFLLAGIMGILVYLVQLALVRSGVLGLEGFGQLALMLLIQICFGVVVYAGTAVIMRIESFRYLLETAQLYLKKKN